MSKKTNLSNPVTSVANEISSLFEGAEGVTTKLFFNASKLKVYVQDMERAKALAGIMKPRHKLGKLHLDVEVYVCAGKTKSGKVRYVQVVEKPVKGSNAVAEAISVALEDNPHFVKCMSARDPRGIIWYFALASKVVCQYLNDDIQNPWSTTTGLAEDVMKRAFSHKGVQISTIAEKKRKR